MALIKNASPQVILLGAEDKSSRVVAPESIPLPQHLPLFMFFAKRGTTDRMVVDATTCRLLYGDDTLEPNEKYFNHATRFMVAALGAPNVCMTKRIIPSDAGARSNANIYIDIIESNIPNYVRDSNGNLIADVNTNDYQVDETSPTISGYKIKFILETATKDNAIGSLKIKEGTMSEEVVGADGVTITRKSKMYPFMQAIAKYQGEDYNNIGFSINSLTGDAHDSSLAAQFKSLIYSFSLYTRENSKSSPTLYTSIYGDTAINFTFKARAIDPQNVNNRYDFEYMFKNNWFNESDSLKPLKYKDYEDIYFYRDEFETVLKMLVEKEKEYVSLKEQVWGDGEKASNFGWYDFSSANKDTIVEEFGMINPFTGRTTKDVKYFSFTIADENPKLARNQREINIGSTTPTFLGGGSDGTLSNEEFEKGVVAEMKKYLDSESQYHDLAVNVESVFYDSGFTLATKKELINFISLRKDTALMLSVHDDSIGTKKTTLSEKRAIALALGNRLKLAPESTAFGTGVCRGMVIGFNGELRDGSSENPVPGTYWLMNKAAKMMGKSTGVWDRSLIFDKAPGNIIEDLINIDPVFIPAGIKPTLWDEGLVWASPYDRESFYVPALQTVYDNDTSVLNSYFPMMALCTLNKIAAATHREFSGTTDLTNAEFTKAVETFVQNKANGIFQDIVKVTAEATIDTKDELRGYSWHLTFKLYGGVMKTVMTAQTQVYRFSDLETA